MAIKVLVAYTVVNAVVDAFDYGFHSEDSELVEFKKALEGEQVYDCWVTLADRIKAGDCWDSLDVLRALLVTREALHHA